MPDLNTLKVGDMFDENYIVTSIDKNGVIGVEPVGPRWRASRVLLWLSVAVSLLSFATCVML